MKADGFTAGKAQYLELHPSRWLDTVRRLSYFFPDWNQCREMISKYLDKMEHRTKSSRNEGRPSWSWRNRNSEDLSRRNSSLRARWTLWRRRSKRSRPRSPRICIASKDGHRRFVKQLNLILFESVIRIQVTGYLCIERETVYFNGPSPPFLSWYLLIY